MKTTHLLFSSLLASIAWADYAKPLIFFAKINDALVPLYRKEIGSGISAFVPGEVSTATKFVFQDRNAIGTDNFNEFGSMDNLDLFHVGPAIHRWKLKLDKHKRVVNSKYYLCSTAYSSIFISNEIVSEHCSEVEVYFLPFDKNTGTAVVESKKPEILSKEHQKYIASSVSKNVPCAFHVMLAGKTVPLGHRTYQRSNGNFSTLCFGKFCSDQVEFFMEGNYAISMNTDNDGYVGFQDDILNFGRTIKPIEIRLNKDRKLINADFYLCSDIEGVRFISTVSFTVTCYAVDIYFLHASNQTLNGRFKFFPKKNIVSGEEDKIRLRDKPTGNKYTEFNRGIREKNSNQGMREKLS